MGARVTSKIFTRVPDPTIDIRHTLTYQSLLFCRVLINSVVGFIIRTYEKGGFW